MPRDTLRFDGEKLGRIAARKGLLRGEVARRAGVCTVTQCNAFRSRPVGVRVARDIAKVVGVPLRELLIDETKTEAEMVKKTA